MARRTRSKSQRNLFAVLGLLVGVGACGQILGVDEYEVVDETGLGGAETGGARTGGEAGDVGVGGRTTGGRATGGSAGAETGGAEIGAAAGRESGGTGGTLRTGGAGGEPSGGAGGEPSGGAGGEPSGGVAGDRSGGAAGRESGGTAGAGGTTGGGTGGATGGGTGGATGGGGTGGGGTGGATGGGGTGGATGGGTGGATGGGGTGGSGTGGGGGCDPIDPEPVCGANARCVPHDSSTAPTCESGVGPREAYRFCTRNENCVAGHTCVQITPDEPADPDTDPPFPGNNDSSVCVQWCRVGHSEDCAVASEECFSMVPARYIGAQEWGVCTPPEAPPTALYDYEPPPEWTCSPGYWGQDGFCDCGCGVFDPDCSSDTVAAYNGCNCEPQSCGNDGASQFGCGSNVDATNNAYCADVWTCPASYWNDSYCDCGCGVVDIDCDSAASSACEFCGTGSCGADNPPGSCTGIDSSNNSICI